jgi:UDP-glucose 6-dehydrogenase
MKNKINIAIIGLGMVGSAVYSCLKQDAMVFDKSTQLLNYVSYKTSGIKDTDYVFVCVDTPSDNKGLDASNLRVVLDTLVLNNYKGIVIVKSTVLYRIMDDYQSKLKLVMNPEFLNEVSSKKDFYEQQYIVLGGDIRYTKQVEMLYCEHFDLKYDDILFEHCSVKESIDFKYIRNMQNIYKLLFWEFVHDMTHNSRKISQMLNNLPTGEMQIIGMDGKRGAQGNCLPKDLKALSDQFKHPTLKYMSEYNNSLIQNGNM